MRASEERHGLFIRPSRSHTRGSHSRFLGAALLIALLVADGLSFPAAAFTTQTWNTTALFDSGTKASTGTNTDTCENVTANGLALNNTGNYQGVGLTTGTTTCATGAWGVNPSGLVLAYDMQTLSAGKMKDFSGRGNDGTIGAANTAAIGKFGGSRNYSADPAVISVSSPTGLPSSSIAVSVWFKIWARGSSTPNLANHAAGSAGGFLFYVSAVPKITWGIYDSGAVLRTVAADSAFVAGTWYEATGVYNGTGLSLYVNGTKQAATFATVVALSTTGALNIGVRTAGASFLLDEVGILPRVPTSSEATSLGTDGRSSFASSGSWTSPSVAFTATPASVTLTFSGGTAANRPSRLRFLDSASGVVVFDTLIPSGLASPIQIPVNLTFNPASWKVKLDMVGSGTATAKMTSILVTLGAAPLFQTSDILFLFGILLLVLSVLCFFTDSPELDLLSFFAAMGFAVWSWLYFFGAFNNSVFALIGIGLGAMVMVLTLGKLTGDVSA